MSAKNAIARVLRFSKKRLFLQNTNGNLRDSFVLYTNLLPKERKIYFLHKNKSVAKLINFGFTCEWFGFTSCFKMLFVIIYVIVLWLLCVNSFYSFIFIKRKIFKLLFRREKEKLREFIYRMWIHSEMQMWHDKNIQTTCNFIKRETPTHVFPVNFAKFLTALIKQQVKQAVKAY